MDITTLRSPSSRSSRLALLLAAVCVCVPALFATPSNATLIGRLPVTPSGTDYQAFYDDELDISWMWDASVLGFGGWQAATDWAAGLTIGGVSGWRLPNMDVGSNSVVVDCKSVSVSQAACLDNELGYHYSYNGIRPGGPNALPFAQVSVTAYWSSTVGSSGDFVRTLSFDSGNLGAEGKTTGNAVAWAVHDGDVAVPEPSTGLLMGLGLVVGSAMDSLRRRRRS